MVWPPQTRACPFCWTAQLTSQAWDRQAEGMTQLVPATAWPWPRSRLVSTPYCKTGQVGIPDQPTHSQTSYQGKTTSNTAHQGLFRLSTARVKSQASSEFCNLHKDQFALIKVVFSSQSLSETSTPRRKPIGEDHMAQVNV